jgi:hypothetical protein
MLSKVIQEMIALAETWPEWAQLGLAQYARVMDAGLRGEMYKPTPEELAGIDRGLKDISEGRIATAEEVERVFDKLRPT